MSTIFLNIRDFFKKIGHFIKNVFKLFKIAFSDKLKYKVVDEAINGYWYDFGYLYNIELAKLKEMCGKFEKQGLSVDNETYVKQMKLAIKLLEIVNNEDGYHFDFDDNGFIPEYVCDVKVNTKNADRFVKNKVEKDFYVDKFPHELYLLKAKHLYHKIREYYEQYWWD